MIVTLPKKAITVGGDMFLPSDVSMFKMTAVKNGTLLYNTKGGLVGQVFCKKNRAEISVADGKTSVLTVAKDGHAEITRLSCLQQEILATEYTVVGDVRTYCYRIFERISGKMPVPALHVSDDPVHHEYYKAKLNDECNPIRLLLFAFAIALLNEN